MLYNAGMEKRAIIEKLRSGDCRVFAPYGLSLERARPLAARERRLSRHCRDIPENVDPPLLVGCVISCLKRGGLADIRRAMEIVDALEADNADQNPV